MMMRPGRKVSILGTATVLVVASLAFQSKGILFSDWSAPTKGTFDSPHEKIGKKTKKAQPWSVTTVASSIEGKTLPGEPISVVGEIVDLSCYLQVGKHGDKHRDCAQKCARSGQPIGLVKEDGTVYMLIDEEHDPRRDGLTTLRNDLIEHMAHVMTINGTLSEVEGQKAIFVQGSVKAP